MLNYTPLKAVVILAITTACQPKSTEYGICGDICQELYQQCEYAAFPSYESCLEGCAYNEEEGADLEEQLTCFQEAECDTFGIIECENQYGANSDE